MNAIDTNKSVLMNVKQMLRLTNTDNDRWLRSLISQRARDLNTNETLIIKNCDITVTNNKFYLPKDCKKILAFRDKTSCIPGIFVDLPFFKQCGCNVTNWNPLVRILDVNGRWANFIGTVPDGTVITISYQAVWTDEGEVVINEEAYTAISNYVAYQFSLSYQELYTREQRQNWRQDGVYQGARVRSAAARRKFEQDRIQIQQKMNQMINGSAPLSILAGTYNSFFYPSWYQPLP